MINSISNVSGIGSKGPEDKLKIPKKQADKYKKRNKTSFRAFLERRK